MKVCEFTTTTTTAQISIQVGQNVGAYITARDSATSIAGQVSNTNDFVYFSSYAGLAAGNYDLHFADTATPLKFNISAIVNATITEIDFSELPFLTTVVISSVSAAVANAAVPSLWAAYGENVPSRGALTTPTLSGEAANIAAILQDFYGWTLNGTELWQIVSNIAELEAISEGLAGNYKLANDIDFAGTTHTDSIFGAGLYTGFTGVLDLNGHAIKNVTVVYSGEDYRGILGKGFSGQLLNGELNGNISATGTGHLGFLSERFGYRSDAKIDGVKFTGTVHTASGYASGLCDNFYTDTAANRVITNCIFDVDVTSDTGNTYVVSHYDTTSTELGKYIVFCNCLLTGSATSNNILGAGGSTVANCYHNLSTSAIDGFVGLTSAEMADPATFAYSESTTPWAVDTVYIVGDIVGDGTYAYIATEPSTGVHPSTLIGWERLGFDFTGTRQGNGYDYGLVGVETVGEVWPGTATQIPQADGSYLDLATGERVVNTTGDNWTVVDLREVWKMVAGVPVLSWEQFGGARSRMSGIAFDLRYSRTTGGARVV